MGGTRQGFVKVQFRLEQDDDGWPPAESEGLWAEPLGEDRYRLDNAPWFALRTASDDIVRAQPDAEGRLWVTDVLRASGNCTIRIIPFKDGPLAGDHQAVLDVFVPLGATGEGCRPAFNIVALDVPAHANFSPIKAALRQGQSDGSWAFEEGCVSEEWLSI